MNQDQRFGTDANETADFRKAFAVGSDPAVSTQVRMELLQTLNARTGFSAVDANKEIEKRDVRAEFVERYASVGLTPDNLPDLLAGHFIVLWRIVNDAQMPVEDVCQAVARQFASIISTSPLTKDAAKRQAMGEALLYEAMLSADAHRAAQDAGNKAELKRIADSAQANFLAQRSINLRKTRLNKLGMVRD